MRRKGREQVDGSAFTWELGRGQTSYDGEGSSEIQRRSEWQPASSPNQNHCTGPSSEFWKYDLTAVHSVTEVRSFLMRLRKNQIELVAPT